MKILIINWRDIKNPESGGAEVHLHEVFKRLESKGHSVTLLTSKFPGCKTRETIEGIRVIRKGKKLTFNYEAMFYYLKNLRNQNFDIIIEDISKIPLLTPLYVKKPILVITHHLHGPTLFREIPYPMALYAYAFEKLIALYRNVKIITVSNSSKKELIKMGIPKENIKIVHNGIKLKKCPDCEESERPHVVYFGRTAKYKRLNLLLKAFKIIKEEIPSSKLTIAGKGNYDYLREIKNDLKLDSVKLKGFVNEEEKARILKKAWVFVTPSMKEGWGITVIEANACGTPVVAYDVEGLKDSIRDGKTGLLVKDGKNVKKLSDAVLKVLRRSGLKKKLSENAINYASEFSWDKAAGEIEQEIESTVRGN